MGERVLAWHNTLGEKYSDLPGVQKYHDFPVVKAHDGTVVMKVREHCFSGSWKDSPTRFVRIWSRPTRIHKEKVSQQKRWQTWLSCMITSYHLTAGQTTCHLPLAPPVLLPPLTASQSSAGVTSPSRKRKQRDLEVVLWYRIQKFRQVVGHTTKAGCPLQK